MPMYPFSCRFEDTLLSQKYYQKAARGMVQAYLALYEKPKFQDKSEETDYSNMTPAQRKREKTKARKAKKVQEQEQAAKEEKQAKKQDASGEDKANPNRKKKQDRPAPVDDDPDGEKLAAKVKIVVSLLAGGTL